MKFQGSVVTLCILFVMQATIGEADNKKEITKRLAEDHYHSCDEVVNALGVNVHDIFTIAPNHGPSFSVYCDSSWIVVQRRIDGRQNFNRTWNEYKFGFGNLNDEFWIGNEKLHLLTSVYNMKIRFDIWNKDNVQRYAEYNLFKVDSEINAYRLTLEGYKGDAGDAMSYHNRAKFSTKDRDNDDNDVTNCSQRWGGNAGWWFKDCSDANLNGEYMLPGTQSPRGVSWDKWLNQIMLERSQIRIAIKK